MKFINIKVISIFFLLATVVYSCNFGNYSAKYVDVIINDSDSSIVRGINMFTQSSIIKQLEKKEALVIEDENSLEYKYSNKEIKEMDIVYFVDENGMYQTEIFLEFFEEVEAAQALAEVVIYFTEKYGKPKKDQDVLFWDIFAKKTSIDINSTNISNKKLKITFSLLD